MTEPPPMLASASTGASGRHPVRLEHLMQTGDWVLDTKLDGVRGYLMPDGAILNRRGADVTHKFPEVRNATGQWLDGEIVALDGRFETALLRESQDIPIKIRRLADQHPVRFVAFDLPDRWAEPWTARRQALEELAVVTTPVSERLDFFDKVRELGMEGVIAKRRSSRYQFGRRSRDWIKFKHLHRISCLVAGYDPGVGSRAHFGAMTLALVDTAGKVVPVGKCGSGFTERQTHELQQRLDAGEILIAEIETVNLTSGGTLRFPVFRGLRTDVAPRDCTTDQLTTLPRC